MATLPDYGQIQSQFRTQAEQDIAPVVSSLQAQEQPLVQRYQSILDQIGSREKADVSQTQTITSREFGRRGIPLSSGVFDTTLGEKLSPIRERYAGLAQETGFAREADLRDLATRIASTRASALSEAATRAQGRYGQELDLYNAEQNRALERSKASSARSSDAAFMNAILNAINTRNQGIPGTTTGGGGSTFQPDPAPVTPVASQTTTKPKVANKFGVSAPPPSFDPTFGIPGLLGNLFNTFTAGFNPTGVRR